MSFTFTKLFSSITESTIWIENDRTRIVWICMLAMADRKGRVWASIPGLANRARVPVEDCRAAIDCFLSPDPDSRTAEHEGRRIEPIDGGWRLLNFDKYRAIRDEETIKESKRNYINNRRANERHVENVEQSRPQSTQAEAEAEAEDKTKEAQAPVAPLPFSSPQFLEAWATFKKHRTELRKPLKPTSTSMALRELAAMGEARAIVALNHTVAKGWQGIREPEPSLFNGTPHQPARFNIA